MAYDERSPAFDPAKAADRRAEVERTEPLTGADAASHYLAEIRSLPTTSFLPCRDLAYLPAPITGRPKTDCACVSLLRPAPEGEVTGAELTFVDALGHPSATLPNRVQWAFREHGCRNSWFWAGGSGASAYVAEGFLAKPLAILSLGLSGWAMGWDARSWLAFKMLPPASITKIVIIADRRPS